MTLSVIIPVYNCREYLTDCVDALLPLESVATEIILIDDGSTDGSSGCCDELAARHSIVRCIHQPNGGVSAARNRGIDAARGDYILFVDADDTVDLNALFPLIDLLRSQKAPELLLFGMYFDYYRHGTRYRSDRVVYGQDESMGLTELSEQIPVLFNSNYLSPVWNKILLRRILTQYGVRFNPDLFLLEDLDFSVRYLACCQTLFCSGEAVYHYRQPEDENNASRRLQRIKRISAVLLPLQHSFAQLAEHLQVSEDSYTPILLEIFLSLARLKLALANRADIRAICDDFSDWTRTLPVPAEALTDPLALQLTGRRVNRIILFRGYLKVRHRAANTYKYLKSRRGMRSSAL